MNDDQTRYEPTSADEGEAPILRAPQRRPSVAPPEQKRRSWVGWLGTLLFLLLVGLAVYWFLPHPGSTPTATRGGRFASGGPMPVVAAIAEAGPMRVTLDALGTVTPLATVTVRTQINGQLTQVAFTEGQIVNKGDFLAEVDPRPYQNALDQAQGQLAKDQALLKNAQLDLTRYDTLVKQDSISRQQRDTQEYLVRQYEGTVRTDQAQVENAKLNLAYCHIVAPVSGRVGLRQVDQGNYVQVSDANGLVVITQLQPISVLFTVPEDNVPAILKRLKEGAKLEVDAYDRGRTTLLAKGTLSTLDNQIDTTTGTVKLRAEFDNADGNLFPNQFVNVQLLVNTLDNSILIPTAAVLRGAPGTFVYLVNGDDTVAVKPVKLGPADGQHVAILDGLAVGDKVVVDGADKLRDGAKVMAPGPTPTNPAGDGTGRRNGGTGSGQGGGAGRQRSSQ